MAVRAAQLVQQALADAGLVGTVKTSGAKGLHVFVPIGTQATIDDVAAATRAIAARAERLDPALATTEYVRSERGDKVFLDSTRAGGATVVSAYSARTRPGVPVSFPVAWDELDLVHRRSSPCTPRARLVGEGDPWAERMPQPQQLGMDLIEEGRDSDWPGSGDARGQAALAPAAVNHHGTQPRRTRSTTESTAGGRSWSSDSLTRAAGGVGIRRLS